MALTNRNILSIVELVFYAPLTVLSLFLTIRHCCRGQRSQITWIFLYLYTHIRVVEAALELATIRSSSSALYGTSILFSIIGVPMILLTTFGLLNRIFFILSRDMIYSTRVKDWYFGLLQIPFEAAIPLCANGASHSTADLWNGAAYSPQILTKIGVVLCVVGFVVMVFLAWCMLRAQSYMEGNEKRLMQILAISLPFLCMRLLYTVLVTFFNSGVFKTWDGNVIVMSLMAVLPEMVVVIIYTIEGFEMERLPKDPKKEKKCGKGRKRDGWPEPRELLDGASLNQTDSEGQVWMTSDDRSVKGLVCNNNLGRSGA